MLYLPHTYTMTTPMTTPTHWQLLVLREGQEVKLSRTRVELGVEVMVGSELGEE